MPVLLRTNTVKSRVLWLGPILIALAAMFGTTTVDAGTPPAQVTGQLYLGLTISGAVGSNYIIQYLPDLTQTNNWKALTNFALPSSPYLWVDTSAPALASRYYRVVAPTVSSTTPTNPNSNLFIWIAPGSFTMGSPTNEAARSPNETRHTVTLSSGFFMSKFLTRQGDYQSLMNTNPSFATGTTNLPVEQVSWSDASAYCVTLTQREQSAGRLPAGWVYRLPTESEWEYACRAGTTNAFYFGNQLKGGMANFDSEYEYDSVLGDTYVFLPKGNVGAPTPVGNYQPNAWGLYDLCGNVWEWCRDLYGTYPGDNAYDPTGPTAGVSHVMRGGSWGYDGAQCRSADRGYRQSDAGTHDIGFRVVLGVALP